MKLFYQIEMIAEVYLSQITIISNIKTDLSKNTIPKFTVEY